MNRYDEYLKKLASEDPILAPDSVRENIDKILSGLPNEPVPKVEEFTQKKSTHKSLRYFTAAASIVFVVCFAMPNLSGVYASAMAEMPVLGEVIKVLTIRTYQYQDDTHDMSVLVPKVEVDENGQAETDINSDIAIFTDQIVMNFYHNLESYDEDAHEALTLDHKVITNTKHWFSMRLRVTETAASSYTYYKYYSIDKQTGETINLGSLFQDKSYIDVLTNEIKAQIDKQMANNTELKYYISDPDLGDEFIQLHEDHNYYINDEGKLVIPFDEYEIAPGYMGCPEFEIPTKVFKDYLKNQYKELFS